MSEVEEVMLDATIEKVKAPRTIRDGEADGEKTRTYVTSEGTEVFTVDGSFSDGQMDTIYQLADAFHKRAFQSGVAALQQDMQTLLGLSKEEDEESGTN